MEYRELGQTGIRISRLGFGGAPIGIANYLGDEDRDSELFITQARDAIRAAVEKGITYFDTAPTYGEGRSELRLGEVLEGVRDRVVLATKYTFDPALTFEQRTDLLKESLQRLRTDRVDVLQLHGMWWEDADADAVLQSGMLDWADAMKARGLCRATGITSEGSSGALERLLHTRRFDMIEVASNVIYQGTCDHQREPHGVIPLARSLNMGVTTMRGPASGFLEKLLKTELPDIDTAQVTRMAIKFVLSTLEVDCCVVGMRHADEVAANAELASDTHDRLNLRVLHDRFDGPLA